MTEGYTTEKQDKSLIGSLIKEGKFSTLLKLLRVTAWLVHAANIFMKRNTEKGALTAKELQESKFVWDLYIQKKCYSEVIQDTKYGKRNNLKSAT